MHFVGVDLAWGQQRPTGVAALDADGRLLHLSSCADDAAILEAVGPYVAGACLVGFDAPLVVANATGNRPAEAELNRDFARFDAGAHPANTAKPEFATLPRGARLADILGLDIDPESTAARRAIEVYPHPATITLFRLGRTLKYKDKKGRRVADLRAELLRLMHLLESRPADPVPLRLAGHAGWRDLVGHVEAATRKSELRLAEDQVDAVVCAHVAAYAGQRPDLVTTYGDLAGGYIVTPTLPADHRPSARGLATPDEALGSRQARSAEDPQAGVRRAVRAYASREPELRADTERFLVLVTTLLDDAGINYLSVTGRAKSVASFAAKAARTVDGMLVYAEPLEDITDQVGVRVITYLHSDVSAVADVLTDQLTVIDDRDLGQETASQGRFGYASRHLLVSLPTSDESRASQRPAQVQVRTVLQHAWAEFEHAIRYKGSVPAEHAPDLDRRFTLAAGLLELADREFTLIRDRLQATVPDPADDTDGSDPRISGQDLAPFLAGTFADAGWSRPDHYAWVSGLLLELGITSLSELGSLLAQVDSAALNAQMAYRYPPGAVRRLDDALLRIYGDRYVALHGNAHREALLRARLEKLTAGPEQADA